MSRSQALCPAIRSVQFTCFRLVRSGERDMVVIEMPDSRARMAAFML
jgi:hypothetical protein